MSQKSSSVAVPTTPQEIKPEESSKQRLPYHKPSFTSEPMFETAALQSCGKAEPEDFTCQIAGGLSS